ncbi:transcriptional regulator (anti-sigma factor) [Allostella vacuolata]|nr:transcriptional regulator (anti-sigma factor) [Stella vacuolata]
MSQPVDPIVEADLQAYVDDELPVARRVAVEAYLCHRPAEALRVMADLRTRDELRLALGDRPAAARPATTEAARRVERGLGRDRVFRRLRRVAAVVLLLGCGWFANGQFGHLAVRQVAASAVPPSFVADAVMAHRTTLVRAGMRSQPEVRDYDPADIRAATAIAMPELPEGWHVTDVQIFPSTFGPCVELAMATPGLGKISLFAVRPGAFDVIPATLAREGDLAAAYWQMGEVAYALVGRGDARELDQAAGRLARSLY